MMPTCREVTGLIAAGEIESASMMSRLRIRLHLAMCAHCARFARQLRVIAQAVREAWAPRPQADVEDLKRRILERLHRS